MALTLYRATVPVFIRMFANIDACLDKASAFAAAREMSDEQLLSARLYPDMLPLARQVQIASDTAKGAGARLSQAEPPSWPDEEKTIAELKVRIARTTDYLSNVSEAAFAGAEERTVTLRFTPEFVVEFTGEDYAMNFALPNFYFHCTTAFAILRHVGVEIGKRDFMGA